MRDFKVEKLMAQLEIPYKIVEHPASHSTEESDYYIEGHEGCRSKTLVLANKNPPNSIWLLWMIVSELR